MSSPSRLNLGTALLVVRGGQEWVCWRWSKTMPEIDGPTLWLQYAADTFDERRKVIAWRMAHHDNDGAFYPHGDS